MCRLFQGSFSTSQITFDCRIPWTSICLSIIVSCRNRSLLANESLMAEMIAPLSCNIFVRLSLTAPMTSALTRTRRSSFLDDHHTNHSPDSSFTSFVTPILAPGFLICPSLRSIGLRHRPNHCVLSLAVHFPTRRVVVDPNESKHIARFYCWFN